MTELPLYKKLPLFSYQKKYVKRFLEYYRGGLPIDCGLGKTRIMLDLIYRLKTGRHPHQTLVISELNVIDLAWPEELKKWGYPLTYQNIHGLKPEQWDKSVDIYLLDCGYLSWVKRDKGGKVVRDKKNRIITKPLPQADLLILDESTNFKNYSSQRFKKMRKDCKDFHRRYLLSAAFLTKNHEDVWAQTSLLDDGLRLGQTITEFRRNYMKIKNPKYYSYTIASKAKGQEVIARIKDLWKHFEIKKESNIIYQNRKIELSPKEDAQYHLLKTKKFCYINSELVYKNNAAAKRVALRQLASGFIILKEELVIFHDKKIKLLQQLLEEIKGKNLLVVYNFNIELEKLWRVFGKGIPVFRGGVKASVREKIRTDWNAGKLPLVFIQPQALSRGVNLQYGGHHICWFSPTDRWEYYYQLNGRLDRIDQPHPVIVHHLIVDNTSDEDIYKGLINKEDAADSVDLQLYEEN